MDLNRQLPRWFVLSSGVILLAAGLLKIFSSFRPLPLLLTENPLLDISFAEWYLWSGSAECFIALLILSCKQERLALATITLCGFVFLSYHMLLYVDGYRGSCTCFGSLFDWMRISEAVERTISFSIALAFTGLGSLLLLRDRRLAVGPALIGLFACSATVAQAQVFEVEGVMMTTNRAPHPPHSCDMRITVSNCLWNVRMQWRERAPDYYEVGSDGHKLYIYHCHTNTAARMSETNAQPTRNQGVGIIETADFPRYPVRPEAAILFLAYASRCQFSSSTNGQILPINLHEPVQDASDILPVDAEWTVNPASGLVTYLAYVGNASGKVKRIPARNLYEILTTADFRQVGGISLPSLIHYARQKLAGGPSPDAMRMVHDYSFTFTATNYKSGAPDFNPVPVVAPSTLFIDNRFHTAGKPLPPVQLIRASATWPTDEEVKATRSYKVNTRVDLVGLKKINAQRNLSVWTRWAFIGLILAACAPLLFLHFRNKTKNKTKTE